MLSITKHIRASLVISLNDGQPAEKKNVTSAFDTHWILLKEGPENNDVMNENLMFLPHG